MGARKTSAYSLDAGGRPTCSIARDQRRRSATGKPWLVPKQRFGGLLDVSLPQPTVGCPITRGPGPPHAECVASPGGRNLRSGHHTVL